MPDAEHGTLPAAGGPLVGVGVDAERIVRFEKLASGAPRWRHVYTPREAAHLAAQPQAALAFCAAFCCKEAVCKGLGAAFSFTACECLYRPGAAEQELVLAPALGARHGLARARVRFHERFPAERGECVVEAHLFGSAQTPSDDHAVRGEPPATRPVNSQLVTHAVPLAEGARPELENRHFSPAEIADLGSRRAQSLAGAFALKCALAALWAAAVDGGALAQPRDFVLGHLASGAPHLAAAPAGLPLAQVRVSIAHTRQWAYGLAALG